jgi:hypothetical protein
MNNDNNDNDIDLNIDNYSFADVLKLFRLDGSRPITDKDLKRCRETADKLHPAETSLNGAYYELFNSAYKVLDARFKRGSSGSYADVYGDGNRNNGDIGADALDAMPYGFYGVVQSKPWAQAAEAAREAAQQAKSAVVASAHQPTVTPSSSLLGCSAPQPFSTRMVTIHTEDRDLLKYPLENLFEVVLPTVVKNVLSMELFDITLPAFYYNVSDYLQNTKLWFSVPNYFTEPIEIAVPSGCYTPASLCSALTKQLNDATTIRLYFLGVYMSPLTQYSQFSVTYSDVERKFMFHTTQDGFILWFDRQSVYECEAGSRQQNHIECWKMLKNWGLGYNLGFYKGAYEATPPTGLNLNGDADLGLNVTSVTIAELDVRNTIYMEVDTFNWIDEISPFSIATTDSYNGDFNGRVNNSFAKLVLSSVSNCYVPVKKFKRILPHMVEKIGRLKFKFRYHNGILVDFKDQPFDFSLKFECRFNN